MLHLTKNCLQIQKWCPYKRRVISAPICANKVRNGLASADQSYSRANQGSCHVHGMSWLCPPSSTFLLAQDLSSKWITGTPTDNIHSKVRWSQKVSSMVNGLISLCNNYVYFKSVRVSFFVLLWHGMTLIWKLRCALRNVQSSLSVFSMLHPHT